MVKIIIKMKHIKLFEQFIYENIYKANISDTKDTLSKKRSSGRVNWFTAEEIQDIRDGAKSIGINSIGESNTEDSINYFGNSNGIGLKDSWKEFYEGGNLCGEVHLSKDGKGYTIVKEEGNFKVNGKIAGSSVSDAISYLA